MPAEWRGALPIETPTLIIGGNLDISTPVADAEHDLLRRRRRRAIAAQA